MPTDESGKIIGSDVDYLDTWKEMEHCVKLGLTESIGMSNLNTEQIDRLLQAARIKPVTNQVCVTWTSIAMILLMIYVYVCV